MRTNWDKLVEFLHLPFMAQQLKHGNGGREGNGREEKVSYNLERAVLLSEHLAPDFGGGVELHQDVGDVAPRIQVAVARNGHRSVVPGLHGAGLAPTVGLGVVELRGGHQFVHLAPPLAAFWPCVDGAVDPRHHHLPANVK